MKRLFFALTLIVFSIVASAQHMSFKGIEMNCNLKSYVEKLVAKNYAVDYTYDEGIVLNGSFSQVNNCEILVLSNNTGQYVHSVVVKFPEQNNWISIKSTFIQIRQGLINKYGKPNFDVQEFPDLVAYGESFAINGVERGKCDYRAEWVLSNGIILLQITDEKKVVIIYMDKDNLDLYTKEKNELINSDL